MMELLLLLHFAFLLLLFRLFPLVSVTYLSFGNNTSNPFFF
jgi:hypothetical protein